MIYSAHSVLKKMCDLQKWPDMIRKLIAPWPQTLGFKEMMISLLRHKSFFTICKKAPHFFRHDSTKIPRSFGGPFFSF